MRKFSYMGFDPERITGNPEIPFAKSLPDYIMRWLASRFLDADTQEELEILTHTPPVTPAKLLGGDVGPACSTCGGIMQRTGSCYTCASCGANTGCG